MNATIDLSTLVPSEATLRSGFFSVEPMTMQAAGYPWAHEIRVALPASYAHTDRSYPVLWITDNNLEVAMSVLGAVDMILVSVGAGLVPALESGRRRMYDFYPVEDCYPPGTRGEHARSVLGSTATDWRGGGAARFLDFLVDDVRTALASEYRTQSTDHGLIGYSAGGAFVTYALFARPGAFAKYICGSAGLYFGNNTLFDLEQRYADEHDDLPGHVFFAAGDGELSEPVIDAFGAVSSIATIAELLSIRNYPSLRFQTMIIPGETHATMLPHVISWGVRSLWGSAVAAFGA